MKRGTPFVVMLAVLALSLGVLVVMGTAQAVHSSTEVNGCAGLAVFAILDQRSFKIQTDTTNPAGVCTDRTTWQLDAGGSITLHYFERVSGLTPPPTPDNVVLSVRHDDTNSNLIILHNAAPPADGATFTFHATTDGTATGTPIAGTFRLFVQVFDDPALGTNDYLCDSDGNEATGALVDCDNFRAGSLRGRMVASSFTHGGYPAGTQYAFGTAAGETVTCTVTKNRVFQTQGVADDRIRIVRGSDQGVIHNGGFSDASTTTTKATTDTIDNSYDAGRTTYGCDYTVQGNSPLTGELWTIMAPQASHGAGITRLSDSQVWDDNVFDANPNVWWDADGTGPADGGLTTATPTPANRGESVTASGFLLNARGEQLTRSVTIRARDAGTNAIEHSATDSGASYGFTYATVATDQARHDFTGAGKHLTASTTGLTEVFTNSTHWFLSSLYQIDPHIQNGTTRALTLRKDNFPMENLEEDLTHQAGTDFAQTWVHVVGVRGQDIDTTGSAVSLDTDDAEGLSYIVATINSDTGSDGWTPALYDPTDGGVGLGAPLGGWNLTANVSFTGNTAQAVQPFTVALGNATSMVVAQTHIVVDVDGLDAGDLIHVGAFFALFLWALWHGWLLVQVTAFIGFVDPLFGDVWPLNFQTEVLFVTLAIWVTGWARGWGWLGTRDANRKE